jgi:hypothetical protein
MRAPDERNSARAEMTGSAKSGSVSTLAEVGVICETTASPIPREHAGARISMQGRERPRGWRRHQSMLDRVEMKVVGATFEIAVIANGVFPEALLPKRILAPMVA